jgi:uncharacterized protein YutE (UPF0331/DUF86 family)
VTSATVVLRKLVTLREYVQRARERRPNDPDVLRDDLLLQDALAMTLLVSVQEANDVCFHIVADEGWGLPASYAEGFEMLARHGVIALGTAAALSGMSALRNRLAQGYASVDHERLWAELPGGLDALEQFVAAIADFVDE